MKVLICADCNDIFSPYSIEFCPRICLCQRHVIWWINPNKGILAVWDKEQKFDHCFILGLHNGFLNLHEYTKESVFKCLDETEPHYLFKQLMTPIVKIIPGTTSDTVRAKSIPIFTKQMPEEYKAFCDKVVPLES